MAEYILAFDFSLSSTGWALVRRTHDGSIPPFLESGLIQTSWAGTQWWAPLRYLEFFNLMDGLFERLVRERGENSLDLAAEQIMWGGQSTPALFALHQRFWEWGWRLRTRIAYFAWARWFHILADKFAVPAAVRQIEGKAVAREAYRKTIGRAPESSDVSDAWGVAYAANRFFALVDGHLYAKDLTSRERQFFDSTQYRKGRVSTKKIAVPTGLLHERNSNYFDWREVRG